MSYFAGAKVAPVTSPPRRSILRVPTTTELPPSQHVPAQVLVARQVAQL